MAHFKEEQNNDHANRVIFEMFYNKIYSNIYYIVKDPYIAQDVTQETFIKAFKQIHTLKEPNKIESWLVTIATRTAIDYLRKIKSRNEITTEDVYLDKYTVSNLYYSTEKIIEDQFLQKEVNNAVSQLKPEYKQVLLLKYSSYLKDEEIANELNMTVGAVKSRVHRAKKRLQQVLSKYISFQDGELG